MPQTADDQTQADRLQIGPGDISQMASDFFVAMLEMPFDANPIEATLDCTELRQATVQIRGEWNALLMVMCSQSLTTRIACAMYCSTEDELSADEISDALGEVANVIGGNAKGMMQVDCTLSLPCVGEAVEPDFSKGLWLTYNCDGSQVTVGLIEQ